MRVLTFRYIELCKSAAENVTLVAPAYEPASKAELLDTLKGYCTPICTPMFICIFFPFMSRHRMECCV